MTFVIIHGQKVALLCVYGYSSCGGQITIITRKTYCRRKYTRRNIKFYVFKVPGQKKICKK